MKRLESGSHGRAASQASPSEQLCFHHQASRHLQVACTWERERRGGGRGLPRPHTPHGGTGTGCATGNETTNPSHLHV